MCKAHFKVESAHAVPRQALRHISASERARAGPPAPVAMRTSPSLSRSLILMSLTLRLRFAGYGAAQDRYRRGEVRVASWALWGCPTVAEGGTPDARRVISRNIIFERCRAEPLSHSRRQAQHTDRRGMGHQGKIQPVTAVLV